MEAVRVGSRGQQRGLAPTIRHHKLPPPHSLFPISTTTSTSAVSFASRKRRLNRKSSCRGLISKMADHDQAKVVAADVVSRDMIFQPILEDGVFRFDCSAEARVASYPSLSFTCSKDRDTPIMSHSVPSYTPTCECVSGKQIVKFKFPDGTSFYGTGEVSGQLERTGKRVFTWNTDAWGYGPGTTSLYQSHPWVLAVLPNGEALGVLADTTLRYVLKSLSHAIGTVFMPPKWSLGYQQCRWSYDSDERVREIARTFREKGIPCDVIWMDIDYMDGFRCFTFDQERFRDPQSLVKDLHDDGFKAIWMLDPGIKKEEGYFVYDSGSKNDVWIKKADGEPFVGEVWPGPCVFPDFTQSKVRAWWAALVKDFTSNGVDGIWNDMNEPAVFKTVTKTMPESNFHLGDEDIGGCQNHTHYHNVYGMLMARSTYEGMNNMDWEITFQTGSTYTCLSPWYFNWDSVVSHSLDLILVDLLEMQHPNFLEGGWVWVLCFLSAVGILRKRTNDHEPWSFGEECEEVCRLALKRRYRLLLHIYTLFYLAHTTGTLVATPTFFADPKDPGLRTTENSFLLGPLLVYSSTIADQGMDRLHPVLPKGIWLRFDFDDSHPDLPTLYLQGGSIIPLAPPHQHVGEANLSDDLTLLVALDQNGHAEGIAV
ncbi:hypothetical protein OIU76_018034 [Salix suchowensis]|nr:hypothetical protein OIU76_018034 [Salix suchowensis]